MLFPVLCKARRSFPPWSLQSFGLRRRAPLAGMSLCALAGILRKSLRAHSEQFAACTSGLEISGCRGSCSTGTFCKASGLGARLALREATGRIRGLWLITGTNLTSFRLAASWGLRLRKYECNRYFKGQLPSRLAGTDQSGGLGSCKCLGLKFHWNLGE